MNKKYWWQPLFIVLAAGIAGVLFMGVRTYQDAPPIPNYLTKSGLTVISHQNIIDGQQVFQKYALMDYGSMFGDGAGRGPDYTADALHNIVVSMKEFYHKQQSDASNPSLALALDAITINEIKSNFYNPASGEVLLSDAQVYAYEKLVTHYKSLFSTGEHESMRPRHYIVSSEDLRNLSSFFFWGAWVCSSKRPGFTYSYTHNWPYDEQAGNLPTAPVIFWSFVGCLGLLVGLGAVLYMRGRLDKLISLSTSADPALEPPPTITSVAEFLPSPTQVVSYWFFAAAAIVFLLQIFAGVLTIHDFVGLTKYFGFDTAPLLPVTITRSWHLQLSLFWITACWMGASIFVLPMMAGYEPKAQLAWVKGLFILLVVTVIGSTVGIFAGPKNWLGQWWHLLGNQGWEFVELGKLWQYLLFACFILWGIIVWRGIRPLFANREPLDLPKWLFYTIVSINVLFLSGFVATPNTNFVIADFWRWCVIHMWVEAFFEVFTTAIIAYFLYHMGLVAKGSACRIVYLSCILFLGSGLLGIAHNFYWNAKPVVTLAVGSVFSTLQVVPLVLLSLEAWRFRQLPSLTFKKHGKPDNFGQTQSFLFLLAVNFWNFMGAGVFGFIINLPIINYFEHGTYLTVNHGHAALMGVYGNLSLAALLFCSRYLIMQGRWNEKILNCAFWSLNIGLALMVALDLFPAGIMQFQAVLDHGLWYARSQEFILGIPFQTLTWMRAIGGYIFALGGVIPLVWFVLSRSLSIKQAGLQTMPAEDGFECKPMACGLVVEPDNS
jgi:nitric oxide reductase subunit B